MPSMKSSSPQITGSRLGVRICKLQFSVLWLGTTILIHASSRSIHDAFIELSKRSEGRTDKPVVKLIFDRGNPKQVVKNHQRVSPEDWEGLGLPTKDQIPHIHFEAMVVHFLTSPSMLADLPDLM